MRGCLVVHVLDEENDAKGRGRSHDRGAGSIFRASCRWVDGVTGLGVRLSAAWMLPDEEVGQDSR